jgi:hypothetical protein
VVFEVVLDGDVGRWFYLMSGQMIYTLAPWLSFSPIATIHVLLYTSLGNYQWNWQPGSCHLHIEVKI